MSPDADPNQDAQRKEGRDKAIESILRSDLQNYHSDAGSRALEELAQKEEAEGDGSTNPSTRNIRRSPMAGSRLRRAPANPLKKYLAIAAALAIVVGLLLLSSLTDRQIKLPSKSKEQAKEKRGQPTRPEHPLPDSPKPDPRLVEEPSDPEPDPVVDPTPKEPGPIVQEDPDPVLDPKPQPDPPGDVVENPLDPAPAPEPKTPKKTQVDRVKVATVTQANYAVYRRDLGHAGDTKVLKVGDSILEGQGISTTQGHCEIAFADGTTLSLSFKTKVTAISDGVSTGGGITCSLEKGLVRAVVQKQPKNRPLVIHAVHADVTVMGTELTVVQGPSDTVVSVELGKVKVARTGSRKSITVKTGEQLKVTPDEKMRVQDYNKLFNSSFEDDHNSWDYGEPDDGEVVDTVAKEGTYSLELKERNRRVGANNSLSVVGGATYRITAYVKTEKLKSAGAELHIRWRAGETLLGTEMIGTRKGTTGWTRVTKELKAPQEATDLVFQIAVLGYQGETNGKAWFDECKVVRVK